MMQLTYEPAFDPLHSVFRALRLREGLGAPLRLPRDQFRILDFYILFPADLQSVRLRPEHQRLKRRAAATKRAPSYGPRPEAAVLFERMRPFQEAALDTLALHGILSNNALEEGWVEQGDERILPELGERVKAANAAEEELIAALRTIATGYLLEGANGLKDRTGLLEHRYDAV
jgi:hypothetical protein